jgi:hypothetical protein
MSRSLSKSGHQVDVLAYSKEMVSKFSHGFYYDRISRIDNVNILNSVPSKSYDWTYFLLMPQLHEFDIHSLIKQSQKIGLLSNCNKTTYLKTLWAELKEVAQYWPCALHAKIIIFRHGYFKDDLYSAFGVKRHLGFDVHSNFFDDAELYQEIFSFAWDVEHARSYRINFIGNRNPQPRTLILQDIKAYLNNIVQDNSTLKERILWIEYGDDPGEIRGVDPMSYLDHLTKSDFTLCPHGYSKLTHRIIEALLRGSIPVLEIDDLELYDLGLQHRSNCIAVFNHNWQESMDLILSIKDEEICQIRSNIKSMQNNYFLDQSMCNHMTERLIATDFEST